MPTTQAKVMRVRTKATELRAVQWDGSMEALETICQVVGAVEIDARRGDKPLQWGEGVNMVRNDWLLIAPGARFPQVITNEQFNSGYEQIDEEGGAGRGAV